MSQDVLIAVASSLVLMAAAWGISRWLQRFFPPSPTQLKRRPVTERWFFAVMFVLCVVAVLWGLRAP